MARSKYRKETIPRITEGRRKVITHCLKNDGVITKAQAMKMMVDVMHPDESSDSLLRKMEGAGILKKIAISKFKLVNTEILCKMD